MNVTKRQTMPIRAEADVVLVRQAVRSWTQELKFGIVDQTKTVTAASELARNTLIYGGGGSVTLEALDQGFERGLRLVFEDQGPGIPDIDKAIQDGYTTGGGLGMGLGGTRRLMNEFAIESTPGQGTRVTIAKWRSR